MLSVPPTSGLCNKPDATQMDRYIRAQHEARHAYAAYRLGVTIDQIGLSDRTRFDCTSRSFRSWAFDLRYIRKAYILVMAGNHTSDTDRWDDDEVQTTSSLVNHLIDELCGGYTEDNRSADDIFVAADNLLCEQAERLLDEELLGEAPAVLLRTALAKELCLCGHLTGKKATAKLKLLKHQWPDWRDSVVRWAEPFKRELEPGPRTPEQEKNYQQALASLVEKVKEFQG